MKKNIDLIKLIKDAESALKRSTFNTDWYLKENDKVKIDVEKIKSRSDFTKLEPEYQRFVKDNGERIFTVHLYRKSKDGFSTLIELKEEPKFLFIQTDLIRVEKGG